MSPWKVAIKSAGLISLVLIFAGAGQAAGIKGKVRVEGIKSAGDIAVYIDAIPGKTLNPPFEHAVIDQRKMTFIPHVTVISQGTTVDFLNSDKVGHNVFWPSVGGNKELAANLGTIPPGQKKEYQFKDVGTAALLCHMHRDMSGYVVVVPTRYFAVTDKEGNYEIKNVPPGQYTIKTWSEEGKPITRTVTVANDTVTANLVVEK